MSDYIEYLKDVFSELGDIQTRKMFGGHGLYFKDAMFGLVADDELYLKVDAGNIQHFQKEGLPPFQYEKKAGQVISMSFHLAPDFIYDDPSEAAIWGAQSWEAAMRAKTQKKPKAGAAKKTTNKKTKTTAKK